MPNLVFLEIGHLYLSGSWLVLGLITNTQRKTQVFTKDDMCSKFMGSVLTTKLGWVDLYDHFQRMRELSLCY